MYTHSNTYTTLSHKHKHTHMHVHNKLSLMINSIIHINISNSNNHFMYIFYIFLSWNHLIASWYLVQCHVDKVCLNVIMQLNMYMSHWNILYICLLFFTTFVSPL